MEELLKKHGLQYLIGDEKVKVALKELAQSFWFRGSNYANDQADGVNNHPDRKRSLEIFFGKEEK